MAVCLTVDVVDCIKIEIESVASSEMKAAILLCLLSVVDGLLPDLTRVVFAFPFTPNLEGDQAYLGVLLTLELVALSLFIGLYAGKRSVDDVTTRTALLSYSQIGSVMDVSVTVLLYMFTK